MSNKKLYIGAICNRDLEILSKDFRELIII